MSESRSRMIGAAIAAVALLALAGCNTAPSTPPTFRLGDHAVARNFSKYPEYNGSIVTISADYRWQWIKGGTTLRCYEITTVDGRRLAAQEFQLKKLGPAERARVASGADTAD